MHAGAGAEIGGHGPALNAVKHAIDKDGARSGVVAVARDAAVSVTREIEVGIDRNALRGAVNIDAGFSHALHGDQRDHHAGPVHADRAAAGAAPAAESAGRQHGLVLRPFPGQSADFVRGNAALLFRPFSGLGNPVRLCPERSPSTLQIHKCVSSHTLYHRYLRSARYRRSPAPWRHRYPGRGENHLPPRQSVGVVIDRDR